MPLEDLSEFNLLPYIYFFNMRLRFSLMLSNFFMFSDRHDAHDTQLLAIRCAEKFLLFLHSLSDMGAAMRKVITKALTNPQQYQMLLNPSQYNFISSSLGFCCFFFFMKSDICFRPWNLFFGKHLVLWFLFSHCSCNAVSK